MGKAKSGRPAVDKLGTAVRLMNMSKVDKYCHYTNKLLPRNGFAWEYAGHLFLSRQAAHAWDKEQDG